MTESNKENLEAEAKAKLESEAKLKAEAEAEAKAKAKAKKKGPTKIYSQASNDVVIPTYEKQSKTPDGKAAQKANTIESVIIIAGGANVAFSASNKHMRKTKWAITEVTADELETLEAHPGFMRRVKKGFISIGKEPAELKADKSAQMTEKQLKAKSPQATPKTGPADE